MMEEESTSETSVNYQITRRNNPEDSLLHSRRLENLKSRQDFQACFATCLHYGHARNLIVRIVPER
jgi:hypothetical protein